MASITVFVDLSGLPHAFVGLTNDQGQTVYYGYSPNPDTSQGKPVGPGYIGTGIIKDDIHSAGHMEQVSFSKTVTVTTEQLAMAEQTVAQWQDNPGTYVVAAPGYSNNCWDFSKAVIESAGAGYSGITWGPHPHNAIPNDAQKATYYNADGTLTELAIHPQDYPGTPAYNFVNGFDPIGESSSPAIAPPADGATTNDFSLTTTTDFSVTPPDITGESPVSADNSTLIDNDNVVVTGVGNVNEDSGVSAVMNDFLSDGYRPGNYNISSDLAINDYAGELDLSIGDVIPQVAINTSALDLFTTIPIDPLVLDLNGDGVKLTDYGSDPVLFDTDHDGGSLERTGWVSTQDGIVVYDLNNNGKIDNISETLSEYFNGAVGANGDVGAKPFANGLAALKSLDSNADNQFTSADTAWTKVKVWVDADHDGKTDSGELKTLASLGITSINLSATNQSGLVRDGNEILTTSTFVQNGQTREVIAANFLTNPIGSTLVTSGNGTLVTTQGGTVNGVTVGQSKAYISGSTTGEVIDVTSKGVNNAYGSIGNDTLTGDSNNNWLVGDAGSDTFNAGAGDDVLFIDAEDQQTNIHGGAGRDTIQVIGDAAVTLNLAQAEIEIAQGGRGGDLLSGGGRSSVFIRGGDGDDIIIGGAANDALSGENDNDLIDGGAGNDIVRGQRGRDQLFGGEGGDFIDGGQDDDSLSGGVGNDVLEGGQGDDSINGGDGQDNIRMTGSYAEYRLTKAGNGWFINDTVAGRDGNDFVKNVETISFRDLSSVKLGDLSGPMPSGDILTVDASGAAFTRTATTRTIAKSQILGNDIDWQNDVLHITAITDVQGGTATINASGDVVFTPIAGFAGIMGFKYQVADAANQFTSIIDKTTGHIAPMKGVVWLETAEVPNDPLTTNEWYLSDANILPVWQNYTGRGVRIGQFEPGGPFSTTPEIFDYHHPDLAPNVDQSWLADSTVGNLAGEGNEGNYSTHATLVAGIMVAARNGEGTVGVAYDATIAGYWFDNNGQDLRVFQKMSSYDIANNSWGLNFRFIDNFNDNPNFEYAFQSAAFDGRQGLGTAIVVVSGNERADGGNANYFSTVNNRYSIAVGAINATSDLGSLQLAHLPFSNPGADILTSAPGSNITSTSRLIENDSGSTFGSDYNTAEGTSFAAPIISGIIALMLEANPKLGYRDIQEILAISSKKINDPNTTWQNNHATNWNGGAMHVSHDYGFGEIDARAAVRLAETWTEQQTCANEYYPNTLTSGTINTSIPDGNTTGISRTLTVSNTWLKVEHVEVTANLTHARAGDLILKLVSPTGTESILMDRPGKTPGSTDTVDRGDTTFGGSHKLSFTFSTVRD
ncbi:serralysin [Gammaproteobacteria bacterium]